MMNDKSLMNKRNSIINNKSSIDDKDLIKKNLIETFNIKNKDIITIVGAGGKTSLMFSASSLFRKDYKVLVTTTTQIYLPDDKFYDELIMLSDINKISRENEEYNNEKYSNTIRNNKNGVYVIGNYIVNNFEIDKTKTSNCNIENSKVNYPKIKGLTFEQLDKISPYFDLVIIEGDGSKKKPLKGWNDNEPVVYHKTTKIIGVVDISSIGLQINEENIHRLDKFLDIITNENSIIINEDSLIYNKNSPKTVNVTHLKNMILNRKGLFKICRGEKILFINKVENIDSEIHALKLIKNIKDENSSCIDKFIYGSIFNNKFIKG